jgi:DNA-binding beta-propeller fold protein YncE
LPSNTMTSGIAYDSNIGAIIVGNIGPNSISVISDSTNTPIQTLTLPITPFRILFDEGAGKILVADSGSSILVLSDGSVTGNPLTSLTPNPTLTSTGTATPSAQNQETSTPTPTQNVTPSVSEFSAIAILPLLLSIFSVAVVLRHRKTAKPS